MSTSDADEGSGWVVEPPSPEGATISVDFSEDSELTPDLREALERLVRALQPPERDVEPFWSVPFPEPTCPTQISCSPLTSKPCLKRSIISCTVSPCPEN